MYDCLVLGSGIAGLTCALTLSERNLKVALLTREENPEISNTYWAQGGIVYPIDPEELIEDITKASNSTGYLPAARVLADGKNILDEILIKKAKVPFERDSNNFKLTKEAAHGRARILYHGDHTGKSIQKSLLNLVREKVDLLTEHTAIDLITPQHHGKEFKQRYEERRVLGAYCFHQKTGKVEKILAKSTVLATGGIGALYLHHSNSEGARGDGLAMAKRAGCHLTNMEFIQFHPTTFYDRSGHRRFLISEALRGEGGILLNAKGHAFMKGEELAPRDVVARKIWGEMLQSKEDCVYLDISHESESHLKDRFPTIFEYCLEKGVNMAHEPIPVVPAAHYTLGGIETNLLGETSLKGLYAVGEAACTGLHGANRLASTSLLEGLVFGHWCGKNLKTLDPISPNSIRDWEQGNETIDLGLVRQDWLGLKQTMWNYVGLIRDEQRLQRAKAIFSELSLQIENFYKHAQIHDELIGLRNATEVAMEVLKASLRNKESTGCFFRK